MGFKRPWPSPRTRVDVGSEAVAGTQPPYRSMPTRFSSKERWWKSWICCPSVNDKQVLKQEIWDIGSHTFFWKHLVRIKWISGTSRDRKPQNIGGNLSCTQYRSTTDSNLDYSKKLFLDKSKNKIDCLRRTCFLLKKWFFRGPWSTRWRGPPCTRGTRSWYLKQKSFARLKVCEMTKSISMLAPCCFWKLSFPNQAKKHCG